MMNDYEFLTDLESLLKKHNVAICAPRVISGEEYSRIEFIHNSGGITHKVIGTTRMHVTAHNIKGLLRRLRFPSGYAPQRNSHE